MTGDPVPTVFLGSGGFGEPSLRRLATHPAVRIVGVVTAPRRPAGRTGTITPTPIHVVADALAIPTVLTPERLRDEVAVLDVLGLGADLLVLADYGRIVPPALLEPRHGALNLHPSLLPRHRGATPVPATILAGDALTGVTLMRMDAGLDTGPIIAQRRWALDGDETTPELEDDLAREGADLLEASLGPWLAGDLAAVPQPTEGASLTRPLRRSDGRLDPTRPAVDLERQVRAYQPWPGSFVESAFGRLAVWAARPEHDPGAPPTGTFDEHGLGVGAGERLGLLEVQPAGGTRMRWDAFVRGRPDIVGSSIVG